MQFLQISIANLEHLESKLVSHTCKAEGAATQWKATISQWVRQSLTPEQILD
jgi:hypothetical protein